MGVQKVGSTGKILHSNSGDGAQNFQSGNLSVCIAPWRHTRALMFISFQITQLWLSTHYNCWIGWSFHIPYERIFRFRFCITASSSSLTPPILENCKCLLSLETCISSRGICPGATAPITPPTLWETEEGASFGQYEPLLSWSFHLYSAKLGEKASGTWSYREVAHTVRTWQGYSRSTYIDDGDFLVRL